MTKNAGLGAEGTPSNEADLIGSREVASLMGISYGSFRSYRCSGDYPTPPPLYKRERNHVWSKSQVVAWIAAAQAEG